MSEPIPESVPQSQVPRTHPPKKRFASTPSAQQATLLASLFSKPDREVQMPPPPFGGRSSQSLPPPPEIVANVQGSSAGAGSGEFHVYKASRRREYERVKLMEEEVAREEADKGFVAKRDELRRRDAERTEKRRKKREKTKGRKGGGGRKEGDNGSEADGIEVIEVTRGEEGQQQETEVKGVEGAGVIICDDNCAEKNHDPPRKAPDSGDTDDSDEPVFPCNFVGTNAREEWEGRESCLVMQPFVESYTGPEDEFDHMRLKEKQDHPNSNCFCSDHISKWQTCSRLFPKSGEQKDAKMPEGEYREDCAVFAHHEFGTKIIEKEGEFLLSS